MKNGVFIVLEGAESSNTAVQFRLLKERLTAVGYDVAVFEFPQREQNSSYFIKQYQEGRYGPLAKLSPYTVSLFYALDRFEAAPKIRQALSQGKVVLANSYVGSSMAGQGGKLNDPVEQRSFFVWEDSLEYQLLNLPRPALNLLINSDKNTGQTAAYQLLAELFPQDFTLVEPKAENGQSLSITDLNNKLWQKISPLLPKNPSRPAHSVTVKLSEIARQGEPQKQEVPAQDLKYQGKLSLAAIYEAELAGLSFKKNADWQKSDYEYFVPEGLPKKVAAKYEEYMKDFAGLHRAMRAKVRKANGDTTLLQDAMPLAALCRVEVSLGLPEAQIIIDKLYRSQMPEVVKLASEINALGRRVRPDQFRKFDPSAKAREPEPIDKILARLAADHLPQNLAQQPAAVELMEAQPKNEFKVLVDAVYPLSNLPRVDLEAEIDNWSYQQKTEALEAALNSANSGIADKFRYRFDITAKRSLIGELLASGLAENVSVQPATPRYGYDVPGDVDNYGIADEYLNCFDKGLELFSSLQAAGKEDLAAYATLAGHKSRFELSCSIASIKACLVHKTPQELEPLLKEMLNQITERHPIAGSGLVTAEAPQPAPAKPDRKKRSNRKRRGGKPKS